jgi:hypothetical protein
VDGNWDDFRERCQAALAELVEGRPEPFKELWSQDADVSIMGAFGAYEKGWAEVGPRLPVLWRTAGRCLFAPL